MFFPHFVKTCRCFHARMCFWQQSENFFSRVRIWRQPHHVVKCLSSIGLLDFSCQVSKVCQSSNQGPKFPGNDRLL